MERRDLSRTSSQKASDKSKGLHSGLLGCIRKVLEGVVCLSFCGDQGKWIGCESGAKSTRQDVSLYTRCHWRSASGSTFSACLQMRRRSCRQESRIPESKRKCLAAESLTDHRAKENQLTKSVAAVRQALAFILSLGTPKTSLCGTPAFGVRGSKLPGFSGASINYVTAPPDDHPQSAPVPNSAGRCLLFGR